MKVVLELFYTLFIIFYSYLEAFVKLFIPVKPKSVKGQIVLVTGGAQGIGREIALRLGEKGARIVLLDVDKKLNEQTAEDIRSLSTQAHAYTCDVSSHDDVMNTAANVKREVGNVDVLINNAGICQVKLLSDLTEQDITRTININLTAHFWTLQEFLPSMMTRNEGHVVTVASVAGVIGSQLTTDYSASKFGVRGLTESVEAEVRDLGITGIKFTTVYPIFTDTKLVRSISDRTMVVDRFGELLTPEYVGATIVDGVLKNRRDIFIPAHLVALDYLKILVPARGIAALSSFLDLHFALKK